MDETSDRSAMPPKPQDSVSSPQAQISEEKVPASSKSATFSQKSSVDHITAAVNDIGRKASDIASNIWSHFGTGPSIVQTGLGKLTNLKLFTPSGAEKFWRDTFCPPPTDKLEDYFACHLSTSVGPVPGTLFVSTRAFIFISDRTLHHSMQHGRIVSSFYKVVIPVDKVASVNPSQNQLKASELHVQVATLDDFFFWFMGFLSYEKALVSMQIAANPVFRELQQQPQHWQQKQQQQ
eukprot:TRINITY_DN6561_c0_g1_i2.p1 TRINITY_DN6561_c0_g1~~TRINITY_DN6561_c0_g1_i2.p1  ORF type:complete len:236 (-),score=60.58 TRINITY_DN6561_c0_g1_i2:414-1121(-)